MNFIKQSIEENLKNNNPIEILKEITIGLDPYLEYYSLLRMENFKELFNSIEQFPFFVIRGACGTGKSSFKTILKNSFAENTNVFEYNCNDITELDDIFFNLYKFIIQTPQKKELLRNQKSNFKPTSIDEQIMNYLKKYNGNLVLIFDNFEKLLSENAELKEENIKSFFQFLSTIENIKVFLFSGTIVTQALELPEDTIKTTRLTGLDENQIKDFLSIFKINAPQSLHDKIYSETSGYIFSLKFLAASNKILNLPIASILQEQTASKLDLNEFLAKKLINKLSASGKKALSYLAIFRHEINANILKTIDKFDNIQEDINLLKSFMLIEGQENFELRNFIKKIVQQSLTDREKMKLHQKVANFYAEQIPLKPNERIIEISRSTMYSEKFYHFNTHTKLEKNFELQSSITESSNTKPETKINSDTIKYIASTKYFPDLEIKQEESKSINTNKNVRSIEIPHDEDITLTEEEKTLLAELSQNENVIPLDNNDSSANVYSNEIEEKFNPIFIDNTTDIKNEVETEEQKADKLLNKGIELFQNGNAEKSISYLKNAMSLLQNNNNEKFYNAKLALAKSLSECFKYFDAQEQLDDLLKNNINIALKIEAFTELAQIYEYQEQQTKALKYYNEALNYARTNNDKNALSKIYFKIALMYDDAGNIDKALYHYLLAATEATETIEKSVLAATYSNIASIYEEQNDINKALEYYNKALKEDELRKNYDGQAKCLSNIGNIFFSKNNTNLAIKFFIQETQAAKKTKDIYLIASSYLELGDTFLSIQDYKNALKAYFLAKKNIDNTISTDSKNKIERRFDMIVDEIGETAYNFLVKELKKR